MTPHSAAGDGATSRPEPVFRVRRVADELDALDQGLGRAVHAALHRRSRPAEVRVVGREGAGRGRVRDALEPMFAECRWTTGTLDAPGPDPGPPDADPDVVVLVCRPRLDGTALHPADRAALDAADAATTVVVTPDDAASTVSADGDTGVRVVAAPDSADAAARLHRAVAAALATAGRRRDAALARDVAAVPVPLAAADIVDGALADLGWE